MSLSYRSRRRRPRRFAFLDRDGVLNVDTGYPHRPQDLKLVPGAAALCRRLSRQGYALIVVTNQSGLARGIFDEADYHAFTLALRKQLAGHGVRLDAILACPHLSGGKNPRYGRWCACRKPAPGLVTRALRQFGGRRAESIMIGDSARDIRAARCAGLRHAWLYRPGWKPPKRPGAWTSVSRLDRLEP